jgi:SAM-dependent methyltransferase
MCYILSGVSATHNLMHNRPSRINTMTSLFKSTMHAKQYAKCRPKYPASLYDRIISSIQQCAPERKFSPMVAIDVGCGTGQASVALAEYDFFDKVLAVDPSEAQLLHATPHDKVVYQVGRENSLPAADGTVAAVTVAQAAHWFDIDMFYMEVDRVLMPGGVLAMWTYGNIEFPLEEELQHLVSGKFYTGLLKDGGYWDARRQSVDDRYRDVPLISSFSAINHQHTYVGERISDVFDLHRILSKEELIGYLRTWSGYVTYCQQNSVQEDTDNDPIVPISQFLDSENRFEKNGVSVVWPVTLLLSVKSNE